MDIPDEFKIIYWLCTHTATLNYVDLPYIQSMGDPWGCNRCVSNRQIFLTKNANSCQPMPFKERPHCPMPASLIVQLCFQICDSKLFDYLSYDGQSQ